MIKEKIALVTIRYGEDINGGAEYHCRMIAERLTNDYDVEVLTTCVHNYNTGINELPEGEELHNNVLIRRFKVRPLNKGKYKQYCQEEKAARKWRHFLFRIGILRCLASIFPIWKCKRKEEIKAFLSYPFYSPDMRTYIHNNKNKYKAFIPINMAESTTFFTAIEVPEKTILIPTMHNQGIFFKAIQTEVMTKVAYIGFNTTAEQKLAEKTFGKHISPHGIISVGIEISEPAPWQNTQKKYKLSDNYLLYIGRIVPGKMGNLFNYFISYKQKHPQSSLQLVLIGGVDFAHLPYQHPDIIYTGFINEAEKTVILQHAKIVVNPSKFESLSLMLLESMNQGRPMIVNGKCNVLKEHCIKSQAALYYTGKKTFIAALHKLDTSKTIRDEMSQKAIKYVTQYYCWTIIINRLKECITNLPNT